MKNLVSKLGLFIGLLIMSALSVQAQYVPVDFSGVNTAVAGEVTGLMGHLVTTIGVGLTIFAIIFGIRKIKGALKAAS